MADEKKNWPLSLNQRHNRLLQDLSASQSRSNVSTLAENPTVVKLEGGYRVCKATPGDVLNEDVPQFSGIADFDSPSPFEMKSLQAKLEDCMRVESDDFGLNLPGQKPLELKTENNVLSDNYNSKHAFHRSTGSGITCLNTQSEVSKPHKVKIEGRRRLCKVSATVDNDNNVEGKNIKKENDCPIYSAISDFDSPPAMKRAIDGGDGGNNEIRDILNDLSAKLEILSIQKRPVLKMVDLGEGSSSLLTKELISQQKKEEVPDYTSAASSFSCQTDSSSSLSDAVTQCRIRQVVDPVVNDLGNENCLHIESEGAILVGRANKISNDDKGMKKIEDKGVSGKSVSTEQPFYSRIGELEEESEDDCAIVKGNTVSKEVNRQDGKLKQKWNESSVVDILVDDADDFILDNDNTITLSGPKSVYKLPNKILIMLYPHQYDGLKWLWSLHCQGKGGILGDDMGLGKTMQICAFLAGLFHSSLIKRALIVAPKTLLSHWTKELSVVGLSEKIKEYFGPCPKTRQYALQYILQDKGVLLTTYDILRNNTKSLCGDHYFNDERSEDDITWDYMILDEGHLIKNPSTQRAKSVIDIPTAHRIIISGTPLQNNLKELWALFNFCCPELLGDKKWFKQKYEDFILRGNNKNASDREKLVGSTVAKDLRKRIQPYFLRRMKSEVFHEDDSKKTVKLPKKSEITVWLRLTMCQRKLYEAFLNSELVLSAFDGSPLAAITILKKICDHPLLLTERAVENLLEGMDSVLNQEDHIVAEKLALHVADFTDNFEFKEKHDNFSCKIPFILSLLDNLIPEGHSVLVFSQTRKMLNLIQDSLVSRGYKFLRLDGTTKAHDRVKLVNDFQEGKGANIFLLTSQVGGLGLTLTRADRVIVVDPAWNPSTDNQSVDRAYRIGQKNDVIVYRLMTCGTVEEKIYRKQIFKGGLFRTATEQKEQIRYFSQQDLRELFSLPKHGFDISPTQQQLNKEHDGQHIMENPLKIHISLLETFGIAGVSHHSLMFSKAAPVAVVQEEEELTRAKATTLMRRPSSSSSLGPDPLVAELAFKPKDVKLHGKAYSPSDENKPTEKEIKERISRLSQIYANKVMLSKLPDKGDKIEKQLAELNLELDNMKMSKGHDSLG